MWIKFSPNPHGGSVGDCAVRAVAAATGQSWEQAYIGLALTGFALGDMPSANRTWGAYLQKHGFKRRLVEADCTTCYTVADFAREYPNGVYVLGCSGHVLAVVNGDWLDSWQTAAARPRPRSRESTTIWPLRSATPGTRCSRASAQRRAP